MSGIDEQDDIFRCPKCGEIDYWTLKGWDEERGRDFLIGFLNNPNMSDFSTLEIAEDYEDWFQHAILAAINKVFCDNCRHNIPTNGSKWVKISGKIKEIWEGRVFV